MNIKSEPYSKVISHVCSLLLQFDNHNGDKFFQTLEIGVSWAEWERERRIDIGSTDGGVSSNVPSKIIKNLSFKDEVQGLEFQWNQYIEENNIDQLSMIDVPARELALRIYSSGADDASNQVYKLFEICHDMQAVGRGLNAYDQLSGLDKNSVKKVRKEDINKLINWLVDGANALRKTNINSKFGKLFWELIKRVENFGKEKKSSF